MEPGYNYLNRRVTTKLDLHAAFYKLYGFAQGIAEASCGSGSALKEQVLERLKVYQHQGQDALEANERLMEDLATGKTGPLTPREKDEHKS